MYNITALNSISNLIDTVFDANYAVGNFDNPDAILVRSAVMHDYKAPQSLLAVARAGAGVNNIPTATFAEQGVVVFNTPGANANAVKELVVAALLLSCRKIYDGIKWAQTLTNTPNVAKQVESGKKAFVGPELFGKKLGILGAGAIGGLVANAAIALGMKVTVFDPFLSDKVKSNMDKSIEIVATPDKIFESSDFITLHMPLNDYTRNTVCADTIAKMKDGVRIINAARGELVNSEDIKVALHSGKVACYVTDFPDGSVLDVENIITIPHLGASTPESEDNCAVMAAEELKDFLENGNIKNSVNLPNLCEERKGRYRLTVIAKETDKADIEAKLYAFKPETVAVATRNGYVYFIADLTNAPAEAAIEGLGIKARLL